MKKMKLREDDGDEVGEEAEKTIRLSQPADNVDLEDSAMHSPEDILRQLSGFYHPVRRASRLRVRQPQPKHHTPLPRFLATRPKTRFFQLRDPRIPRHPPGGGPGFWVVPDRDLRPRVVSDNYALFNLVRANLLTRFIANNHPLAPSLTTPSPEAIPSRRYLGNVRPAPFTRAKTIGDGKTLFKKSNLTRYASASAGQPLRPLATLPLVELRQAFRTGKDFTITTNGKRVALTSSSAATTDVEADSGLDEDSSSEEDVPLAKLPRVSVIVPLPGDSGPSIAPRDDEPRKRNRLGANLDPKMHERSYFSFKGKEKQSDREMVIDVDPTTDEEAGLDGAVEQMSLDGPVTDPDVDVVGISSGSGPDQGAVAASPIQTRARRRLKEVAAAAAAPKRSKRAPRAGTRTSSRLAAMTSTL
ncbi:hypothetical protein RhiXN_05990 [Rhizoctonia solani]|uniref:Uncharacterized protein n=1 Tax=Rhizoctonia solani TaxID=456999 RepID=A0A8H8NVS8_9AGAM|nr:uncharacterized protein RhiXN_05990 [Rhizoctonia solani]QRW21001.1 hypothetical protein RhiXN_05990 [Rhizoctonia solani]